MRTTSFREFIDYEPPPKWARDAIQPVAAHFGNNLATGFQAAGERLGFNPGHVGGNGYGNLSRREDPANKPRMTDDDRRSVEGLPDLKIVYKANYILIPITVSQYDYTEEASIKEKARRKVLADPGVQAMAKAENIRLGKMIFMQPLPIVDPKTGEQMTRLIVKLPLH